MTTYTKITDSFPGNGKLREFEWSNHDITPHWLRYGKGHARARFQSHIETRWLSIDTSEYGEKSGKRTMISLNEPDARLLYAWLKTIYEPEAA